MSPDIAKDAVYCFYEIVILHGNSDFYWSVIVVSVGKDFKGNDKVMI